jgi:hypothetical protein
MSFLTATIKAFLLALVLKAPGKNPRFVTARDLCFVTARDLCFVTARDLCFVTGHDFSRAAKAIKSSWALQAAEKLHLLPKNACFVTGHDFSRAAKAIKSSWALAPAAFGCLLLFAATCSPAASQTGSYRIAGTVVNSVTGEPVRHAAVAALAVADSHTVQSVFSSDGGHFALERLPAAKYQLTASKLGYLTSFYDQRESYNSAIVTGEGQDTEHLTFRLPPSAAIVVAVTDDGGDPVDKATVLIFKKTRISGRGEQMVSRAMTTDDAGTCEMDNLEAGPYFVAVSAKPWFAMHTPPSGTSQQTSPRANPALDVAYPVTFFDGVTDQASATPLMLAAGHQEHIDIVLHAVPALRLSVQMPHAAQGVSAPPQLQQAIFGFAYTPEGSTPPVVTANGIAEFVGVAPGSYELVQGGRLVELEATAANQQIAASTGTPAPAVHLTVRTASGAALAGQLALTVSWTDAAHPKTNYGAVCNAAQCTLDSLPPGQWELWVTSGDDALPVVSTTINGHTHAGNLITVTDQNLEVAATVQPAETRVEGMAQKAGKGLAGVMIVLVPQNPGAHGDLFRRDQTDSDGSFSLQQVAPGSYTVVAIEDGWELDWARPEVIGRYLSQGIAVTVKEDSGKLIRLSAPVPVQSREPKPANAPANTPANAP